MALEFRVEFNGIVIGRTFLEHGDAPMCCVSGRFIPNTQYGEVRQQIITVRQVGASAVLEGYVLSPDGQLRIFSVEGLTVSSHDGVALGPAAAIYIEDWTKLGLDEIEVHIEGLEADLYHLFFRRHLQAYREAWRIAVEDTSIVAPEVDAVVNAANSALSGGGGVDTAIHRAAGPGLLEECRRLGRCPVGDAVVTAGHGLRARHVIHAVAPAWEGGGANEIPLLARCYRRVFGLARERGLKTLAVPALSCGAHRFPAKQAAAIAVRAAYEYVSSGGEGTKVIFCVPNVAVREHFERARREA